MKIELIGILVGLSIGAFGFSIVALVMGCLSWTTMIGLKNSTHQVQYVPIDPSGEEDPDDVGSEDEYGNYEKPQRERRQEELHNDLERAMGMNDIDNDFV